MFFGIIPSLTGQENIVDLTITRSANVLGALVGLVVVGGFLLPRMTRSVDYVLKAVAFVATPAIAVLGVVDPLRAMPIEIHVVLGFASGIGEAVLLMELGFMLAKLNGKSRKIDIAIAYSVGGGIAFGLSFLPLQISNALAGISVLFCQILLMSCYIPRSSFRLAAETKATWKNLRFRNMSQGLLLFSMLFGMMSSVALFLTIASSSSSIISAMFCFPGIVYLAIRTILKDDPPLESLEGWLFSLAVIAILAMPVTGLGVRIFCLCLLVVTFNVYDLMSWGAALDIGAAPGLKTGFVFVFSRSFNFLGLFLGWILGFAIMASGTLNETFFVNAIVIVVAAFIIVRNAIESKSRKSYLDNDRHSTPWRDRCEAVATEYRLSPKEREVLFYLAKGRNVAYISKEMVLSEHTIKSHLYRIYQKTDVHSQQDLIDLVDGRRNR